MAIDVKQPYIQPIIQSFTTHVNNLSGDCFYFSGKNFLAPCRFLCVMCQSINVQIGQHTIRLAMETIEWPIEEFTEQCGLKQSQPAAVSRMN